MTDRTAIVTGASKRVGAEIAQVLVGRKGKEWWQQREQVNFPIPVVMVPADKSTGESSEGTPA